MRQSLNTNPNHASAIVAFHSPLSYYKTHLSSLQTLPARVWTFQCLVRAININQTFPQELFLKCILKDLYALEGRWVLC